jgi:hypothetical protein
MFMRFYLITLFFTLFLTACDSNSQKEELDFQTPNTEAPDPETPETPEPETPDPETPDPETPVTPEPETPDPEPPVTPEPEPEVACINDHSGFINGAALNSTTDYVFFPRRGSDLLSSINLQTLATFETDTKSFNSEQRALQRVYGDSLANKLSDHNGLWLIEPNRVMFTNTETGQVQQISNLDVKGQKVCEIKQLNPSFDREAEFYINYGPFCEQNYKVHLAMSANESAIKLPNNAVRDGISIYDAQASWQGQIHKKTHLGESRLVFSQPDFCTELDLVNLSQENGTWYGIQNPDGRLLLRLEDKVYLLSANETQLFITADSGFSLPEQALFSLDSKVENIELLWNDNFIFYFNKDNPQAKLGVYDLSQKVLLAEQAMYTPMADAGKTFKSLNKWLFDQQSLWLETRYQVDSDGTVETFSRYNRWDFASKTFDDLAVLDHKIAHSDSFSDWHSVDNRLYVKVKKNNGFYLPFVVAGDKDYLLAPNSVPQETSDVWYFIKVSATEKQAADSVLALDYSALASDQLQLRLIKSDGSEQAFPQINRNVGIFQYLAQYGDASVFYELSCTSGCTKDDLVQQQELNILLARFSDVSLHTLYSETCTIDISSGTQETSCTPKP